MNDFVAYIDDDGYICAKCAATKRTIRLLEQDDQLRLVKIDLGIVGAEYYSEIHMIKYTKEEIQKVLDWLVRR